MKDEILSPEGAPPPTPPLPILYQLTVYESGREQIVLGGALMDADIRVRNRALETLKPLLGERQADTARGMAVAAWARHKEEEDVAAGRA